MKQFILLWSWRNGEHIERHEVAAGEAEHVVRNAHRPYPEAVGDEKWLVRGPAPDRRLLQVIFVRVMLEGVAADEFQRLKWHERLALEEGETAAQSSMRAT